MRLLLLGFSVLYVVIVRYFFFFFQAEDGIRDTSVTGVQTCALPIFPAPRRDHWRAEGITRPGGKLHGVTNFELARLFYEMASLLEVRDESRFRIRAWQRAAQTLETLSEDVAAVAARGGLRALPGIGKEIGARIEEYLTTGRIELLERLRENLPPDFLSLLEVRGLGPRTARALWEVAGIDTIERLEAACRSGQIIGVAGIQKKTCENLLKAIARHQDGLAVDLRVVAPEAFGAALQYFTGSKAHNVRLREMAVRRGLKISEYGVFDEATGARVAGETEEDVYAAVGLPWIPPELREDGGEIDAAREGRLPALVERAQLRGDLHDHTEWSDGHHPLERLVEAAEARGYEYVIVSDHSRSLTIAQGLSVERLRQQRAEIRAVQARHAIRILAGSECDILEDGRLDFPDEVLAELDVVVASVHSRFKQDRATMTARIVRALESPHVDILGHPTGRRLGSREPYDVDLAAVFAAARAP